MDAMTYLEKSVNDLPPTLRKSLDKMVPLGWAELNMMVKVTEVWLNNEQRELTRDEVREIEDAELYK
jgi:hypothetical protein